MSILLGEGSYGRRKPFHAELRRRLCAHARWTETDLRQELTSADAPDYIATLIGAGLPHGGEFATRADVWCTIPLHGRLRTSRFPEGSDEAETTLQHLRRRSELHDRDLTPGECQRLVSLCQHRSSVEGTGYWPVMDGGPCDLVVLRRLDWTVLRGKHNAGCVPTEPDTLVRALLDMDQDADRRQGACGTGLGPKGPPQDARSAR